MDRRRSIRDGRRVWFVEGEKAREEIRRGLAG
jgi:hypothetical protein